MSLLTFRIGFLETKQKVKLFWNIIYTAKKPPT